MWRVAATVAVVAGVAWWVSSRGVAEEPQAQGPAEKAAEILSPYQVAPREDVSVESQVDALVAAARDAALTLGDTSERARVLREVADRASSAATEKKSEALSSLRTTVQEVYLDLTFRPRMEAELPAGFPGPAPVGDVVVKEYPAYRLARTKMDDSAFWSLFFHIQKNDIAMTAPVEMQYGTANTDDGASTMAFLYGQPDLGTPGAEGRVEVVDVPPMTTVSTGVRGGRSDASVSAARQRLERWLAANADRYEPAGTLRVMGYNSPFVPRGSQFFEVEFPIRAIAPRESATGTIRTP